jgi:prepilin-type N-terminal cleavage/methylation domain-containing protein
MYHTFKRGFSLLEILLSLTLIGIMAGMVMPVSRNFLNRNELDQTVTNSVYFLRRAQALALAGDGDSAWGVKLSQSSILLFKGDSYATRDSLFDESISIAPIITFSGVGEFVFQKGSGLPSTTGTSSFTLFSNETRTITVNQKGMVSY